MIKSAFHISKRVFSGMLIFSAVCLASCAVDEMDDRPEREEMTSDDIRIGAAVKANIATRGYKPSGTVDSGEYILTYPFTQRIVSGDTTYTYQLADVRFGERGIEDIGFVTSEKKNGGERVNLKWSDVSLRKSPGGNKPQSAIFYMDNVPVSLHDTTATPYKDYRGQYVMFPTEGPIPFEAGRFDDVEGTNDLLWGTASAPKNAKRVDFELHHNMARVKVIIDVKPREENPNIMVDLTKVAKLEITNLVLRPESFDRTTGNLLLPVVSDPQPLKLVDIDNRGQVNSEDLPWVPTKDNQPYETITESQGDKTYSFHRYTAADFVLPPQELVNDSNRPTLKLTIPAKYLGVLDQGVDKDDPVTFEASLPQNMYVPAEGDGSQNSRPPMPLSFMKEHVLTIRATVGPPDMQLEFAPVYVEDWVGVGDQNITGQQAGIYNNTDFYNFLDYYQAGNTVLLEKYGYKNGTDDEGHDKWVIMFWSRTINLPMIDNNETGEKGIVDYLKGCEYLKKIPFTFSFNNYVIKTDDATYAELSGASGQIRLYNWLTGETLPYPGISTAEEFKGMIEAYNMNSKSAMQNYGAYDNTDEQWVFELREDVSDVIELSYDEIHNAMKFFTGGGNFTINFRGKKVKVTNLPVDSPYSQSSIVLEGSEGELILHAILADPAGIYSPEDVQILIKAYNTIKGPGTGNDDGDDVGDGEPGLEPTDYQYLGWLLENYGTESGGSWTFKFIKAMELNGPDIYGTMVPDAGSGLPKYDFRAVNAEGKDDNSMTIRVSDTGTYAYNYRNKTEYIAKIQYYAFDTYLKSLFSEGGSITTAANLKTDFWTNANNGNPILRRHYGWYDRDAQKWMYPVDADITVAYNDINGKLTSAELTEMLIRGDHKVTVTGLPAGAPDLICRGKQGAEILLRILYGTYKLDYEAGIEIAADFKDLISAYKSAAGSEEEKRLRNEKLQRYGYFDEAADKWVFGITETADAQIEVKYDDLYGKMQGGAEEFSFNLDGHSLKVTGLPTGASPTEIVLSGTEGEVLLHAILTAPAAISSRAEVEWLIKAYNSQVGTYSLQRNISRPMRGRVSLLAESSGNYDWILGLFGKKTGDTWTFTFGRSMQLNGPDIYGKMIPEDGKPAYKFAYAPESGVQVVDGTATESVKPDDLRKLFSEDGKVTSPADLVALANAGDNPVVRRYYGKPNPTKWSFTVTNSFTVSYPAISGKLASIDAFDLVFADENVVVTLSDLPRGYRPIVCTGAAGAGTLYSILRGTYPAPVPGIESLEDVAALIAAYKSNSEDLWIYGTQEGGAWTFTFRETLTLEGADIYGKMVPVSGRDYSFAYDTGKTVSVTDNGTTEPVTAAQLKTLFSASGKVTSSEGLQELIACGDNPVRRRYYGTLSGSQWSFPVSGTFSVPYSDNSGIFGKLTTNDVISGITGSVTVTGLPGGRQITCTGSDGAKTLTQILRGTYEPRPGIELASDISPLTTAYDRGDEETLKVYGTQEGDSWTFTFYAPMTLNGSDVFGKMVPGGKPDYSFNLGGNAVSVSDGTNTESVTAEQLKTLFSGSGKVTSATDLNAMISAANGSNLVKRWYHGRLDGTTWTYPVASSFSVDYNTIKGKLTSNDAIGFAFGDGVTVTVTGLPGGRQVVCGAGTTTLYAILHGDYVPESGIDEGDIPSLTKAYNANDVNELQAYGTESGGKWTFTFREAMTLEGTDVYGRMIPDGSKPDYAFDLGGKAVSVHDGTDSESVTAAQLKTLFSASGKVTDLAGFNAMIEAANGSNLVKRWYHGRSDGSKWTYAIAGTFSVDYNTINGELTSTDAIEFAFESEAEVTVTGLPYGYENIVCRDAQTAAVLYEILRGTHTLEPPQTGGGDDGDDGGDDGDGGGNTGSDPQP